MAEQGLIPSNNQFGVALSDIVRCQECGHMQLARLPAPSDLSSAYADAESGDYIAEEAGQRATARVTLDRIERRSPPGRLLDVGSWVGYLLDEARGRGWSTVGIEPSSFASAYARDRFGLDVRTEELHDAEIAPRSCDAVVLCDVIEHIPDPGAALDRIAGLCRPDAVLYLALPDAGSRVAALLGSRWWSVLPTHVQYFTRRSLRTLLARHGWQVLDVATAPKAFTVGYYVERTGGYSPAGGESARSRGAAAGHRRARLGARLPRPDGCPRSSADHHYTKPWPIARRPFQLPVRAGSSKRRPRLTRSKPTASSIRFSAASLSSHH